MGNISGRFAYPDEWEYLLSTLNKEEKLFRLYITQRCDIAGVHQIHYAVDSAYLGFKIDRSFIQTFLKKVNEDEERVLPLKGQRLWLVDYARSQQKPKGGPLSDKSGPHIKVVRELKKHGIFEKAVKRDPELFENYSNQTEGNKLPYSKGNDRVTDGKPKGYSSSSGSGSGSGSGLGDGPPPGEGEKKESLSHVAERCLKVWPQSADEIFFSEAILAENYLRQETVKGESVQDAEARLTDYLEAQKGNGRELEDVLKTLIE